MNLRFDVSIGPKNEGNPLLVRMVLLLPHFTFRLIIRYFLVQFRYTGTIISSDAMFLGATKLFLLLGII